jgi:hypothetical protein
MLMNIEQKLKKNVRWLARRTGKSNKQVMDDIMAVDKLIMGDEKKRISVRTRVRVR